MALFVIGDLHLALGCDKPMDIFPGWEGYVPKLEENWRRLVRPGDTVVLAGDTSWAMQLENTQEDFAFIEALPGRKVLLKGNHDYWWNTASKMETFLDAQGLGSLSFLHNNCVEAQGAALCGTRGWYAEDQGAHTLKMMNREALRLRASLDLAQKQVPGAERIAFLHYPPFYGGKPAPEFTEAMREFGVRRCYYGHLHGRAIQTAVEGEHEGVLYRLISADALRFSPHEIVV